MNLIVVSLRIMKKIIVNLFISCLVPCLRRAASVEEEYEAAGGEVLLDNEDNDGWLATHGKPNGMLNLKSMLTRI